MFTYEYASDVISLAVAKEIAAAISCGKLDEVIPFSRDCFKPKPSQFNPTTISDLLQIKYDNLGLDVPRISDITIQALYAKELADGVEKLALYLLILCGVCSQNVFNAANKSLLREQELPKRFFSIMSR